MATATTSARTWRAWGLGFVHGPSQIFFQRNAITGVLILAAFVVADWRMAVLVLVGAAGGMIGGRLSAYQDADIAAGRQSFCGALVGAAVFAALGGSAWWSGALAFAGGIATGPVTRLVDLLFTRTPLKTYALPYTTAPFVIVATIIAVSTRPLAVASSSAPGLADPVPAFLVSLLTNVSQVVLVDSPWAGALILAGLFVAGLRIGLAAVLGSVVGSLVSVALGEPWTVISSGIEDYSGVLTAIALAVAFFKSSVGSWLYALPWIVVTAVVTLLMHRLGLDTYTWPYILTTWVALIVAHHLTGLRRS